MEKGKSEVDKAMKSIVKEMLHNNGLQGLSGKTIIRKRSGVHGWEVYPNVLKAVSFMTDYACSHSPI